MLQTKLPCLWITELAIYPGFSGLLFMTFRANIFSLGVQFPYLYNSDNTYNMKDTYEIRFKCNECRSTFCMALVI